MENQLAENIREYRKSMGLTQEQLAERLGITLGTVSKWERGSSEPDLGYLMDLAELFRVSVDALIGFTMRGSNADEEADRIEALVNHVPFEEVQAECEKALKKFPNHFRIVLDAASIWKRFGAMHQDEPALRRALELYRHAVELISQNRDPEISEASLRNEIAGCYASLKDYCRAVEEYKKNNLGGINDANIGILLVWDERQPEEGIPYIERAFLNHLTGITTVMCGYLFYYLQTGDTARGIRAAEQAIDQLSRAKEDPDQRSFMDKLICLIYLLLAVIRDKAGQPERAEEELLLAVGMARAFDGAPVYTPENMMFTEHMPHNVYFYDDAGPTAMEGLRSTMADVGDLASEAFRRKFELAMA